MKSLALSRQSDCSTKYVVFENLRLGLSAYVIINIAAVIKQQPLIE